MSEPGLCVPLGGCAHESSCTSCNLLGRVSQMRNSRQDKDIRLAGCALPRGGYKGGRWSPVATVHRRPRRQPRPAPFEKLYYYFEFRNPPPTTVSPFLLHRQFVGGGRGVGRVTAQDRKIPPQGRSGILLPPLDPPGNTPSAASGGTSPCGGGSLPL